MFIAKFEHCPGIQDFNFSIYFSAFPWIFHIQHAFSLAWLHLFRRITVGDLKVPDVAERGDIEAIYGYNQNLRI
jgi:hypothetical protein